MENWDHTGEFYAQDVSENKVLAMTCYLMGIFGVILCLLSGGQSPYAAFHAKQALKITVAESLCGILAALLCWTFIVPIAAGVLMIILWVVKIICFFSICKGEAKEPPIIRNIAFLK